MCCIDNFKVMKNLKKVMGVVLLALLCGCTKHRVSEGIVVEAPKECGQMTVILKKGSERLKSIAEYESANDEESAVYKVDVLVFDAVSKRLERTALLSSLADNCAFELPVGEKIVYAVVNGPDLIQVQSLDKLLELSEDLYSRDYHRDGFVMVGYQDCVVSAGNVAKPEILVKRLVSRIQLRSVKCNVSSQYESIKVESVFLGNAHSVQSLSGDVSVEVNKGGYADAGKTQAIGRDGVAGSCQAYMYREPGFVVNATETVSQPVFLYCQPDMGKVLTCLYMRVAIGDGRYYYRVPLDKGFAANTTCVVDVVITNLGAPEPPDGDMQKGEIQAVVTIAPWDNDGKVYHAEF